MYVFRIHSLGWDILPCDTTIYYLGWPHCGLTVLTDLRQTNENISSLKYYCMSWHIRWPFKFKNSLQKWGWLIYQEWNEKLPISGLRVKTWGLADVPPSEELRTTETVSIWQEKVKWIQKELPCNREPTSWRDCCTKMSSKTLWFDGISCMYVAFRFSKFLSISSC